jgi:hypothetical protein
MSQIVNAGVAIPLAVTTSAMIVERPSSPRPRP